jgi:hypothetical protein
MFERRFVQKHLKFCALKKETGLLILQFAMMKAPCCWPIGKVMALKTA